MNDKLYSEKQIEQAVSKLLPNDVLFALGDRDKVECASIWITRLQQQNQELREEFFKYKRESEKNKNKYIDKWLDASRENQELEEIRELQAETMVEQVMVIKDLKAFIKEACEVIEFYGYECFTTIEGSYGRSYQNYHVVTYEDIEGKGEDQSGGKRARQFMNTDKYKQLTEEN